MITSSDVSSSFILKNGTKWELLLSPFTGKEKWRKWELSEIPGRIWVKTCAFLMLACYLQSRPVLCLLILSHTPNTTQLLRKRIRVTPRGWLAWAWAHLRSLPHKAANGIATAALRLKGFWHRTEKVHFPPGQHQQTHQLPGVIRQVWVATENFIFPLLATVAVHSPVAYEKKRFILIFQMKST